MQNAATLPQLAVVLGSVIKMALTLVGLAAAVMFLIAGINYIGAGGDKEATSRARNTLTYAIIGLVVAVSAWMIINLLYAFLGLPNAGLFNICISSTGCP